MAGLLEQLLARAQPGGFVDPAQGPDATAETPKDWAAILRAKRRAENARFDETVPPLASGSLLPFGALGAGMLPPTPSQSAPAAPALAGATSAPVAPADPATSGALPGSAMALRESDGAPQDQRDASLPAAVPGAPLDLGAAARMPPAAAPAPVAPTGEPPFSFGRLASGVMDKLGRNSSTLLALGAGLAGAPNVGQGISRAAAAAIPASQADKRNNMALDNQRQTFQALIGMKVPPNEALAAVGNPEMMKAIIAKYAETKPFQHVTVTDSLGNQKVISFNPNNAKWYDASGKPVAADELHPGMETAAKMAPNFDPSTRRDEAFLSALDPITQAAVRDIADGKMPATGRNLQKLMPLVARYENGFDNTTYQARQKLQSSYYGGGEGAKALRSVNTTVDHGIQLQDAIKRLNNFTTLPQYMNSVTGDIKKQYDPEYQKARKDFSANAELYAKELDFALTGKSTVSGTNHLRQMFDINASTPENLASLTKTLSMLQERVHEHQHTYSTGMNAKGEVLGDMVTRGKELEALLRGEAPQTQAVPGATAASGGKTRTGVPWSIVQ